jgi:flavin-dependent dehydrogenase
VIIVGSGPAGSATALELVARDPALAHETLILEKATHPRDKTCAGGLIPKGVRLLRSLGIELDVPNARVDRAGIDVPRSHVDLDDRELCRVVRRREFDARLAGAARDRGVELREGQRVVALERDGDGVRVTTDDAVYWARAVVGADGSGSHVRRALVPGAGGVVGRAVMADVPVRATTWTGFERRRYDFDFRACAAGLRGYGWMFPCVVDGEPSVNVGAYGLPPVDGVRLQRELTTLLERIGARTERWKAFPIRTLGADSVVAAPRALLVGDAAGIEPLLGEGISFALEYGALAAQAIVAARATGNWSFADYGRAVHAGPIGRKIRVLRAGTRLFYGRRSQALFRVASLSARAQGIALRWYNGVDGWDERGKWQALWALVSRQPIGAT